MAWTVEDAIRVGRNLTNTELGELAKEIDALHDGFVSATGSVAETFPLQPINSTLNMPNGVKSSQTESPPYTIYSFENGYKRKPPYLVVATFYAFRSTTSTFNAWIIRQPTYIKDVGRELTAVTEYTADYKTELFTYNSVISNIEGVAASPDGYLIANTNTFGGDVRNHTIMRLVEDDLPARFRYSNGDTLTHYNDYFHIATAPVAGSAANLIFISQASMTIIGGR